MNDKRNALKAISKLIHANEHRSEVYRRCYNKAPSTDLKILFNKCYSSAITNVNALSAEVNKLGFESPLEETASEMIFKVLLELRSSISGSSVKSLLNDCEEAEDHALYCYYGAINSKAVLHDVSVKEKLSAQSEDILEARQTITTFKNQLKEKRINIQN